ncbi:MAG: hypothetical protein LQ339_001235 [Xanthoria mediterranea]|nr:MAG: hypothetical protein LQ339_001235 [Xanthoria mediterranea]
MDTTNLLPLLEILDDDIDELEETLAPVTNHALGDAASKLPLLDKAQLYILVTYAIESILFSYLRLNGIDAREHAVFRELTRVKQYFQKAEDIEKIGSRRENLSLDKAAAGRMIKHALTLALYCASTDKVAGTEGNNQHNANQNEQTQNRGQLQVQTLPTGEDISIIKDSQPPEKQAWASYDKRASKKVKLGSDSPEEQMQQGDKAVSSLMANTPAYSSSPVTTSEPTSTVGVSDKGEKRRKRKR